jgi:UDP-glucose 6-dehydrogenase
MSNVLIIGYGTVGRNLEKEIADLKPDIVDKYKDGVTTMRDIIYDIGFICVDTPLKDNGLLDTAEVENAIMEYKCKIYCIKSTCPVGTVEKLILKTGKDIVFSPEYYGGTHHCNNYDFNFTILGGQRHICDKVIQILLPCYDGRHQFRIVNPEVAELVKFMENSFIATKVSFCTAFYNICEEIGVDYVDLRELFVLDPRINPSHTFVYKDHPYWDSHCLNKDVPSIANQFDSDFIKNIIGFNVNQKRKHHQPEQGGILHEQVTDNQGL